RNSVDAPRWREALPLVQAALAAYRAAGETKPDLWFDLIDVRITLGDPVGALETLREHQNELDALADPELAATACGLAATAYLMCGLPDLAEASLDEFDRITAPLGPDYVIERAVRRANFARATEDYPT